MALGDAPTVAGSAVANDATGRDARLGAAMARAREARAASVAAVAHECEATTCERAHAGDPASVVYMLARVTAPTPVPALPDLSDAEIDAVLGDMACGVLSTLAVPARR